MITITNTSCPIFIRTYHIVTLYTCIRLITIIITITTITSFMVLARNYVNFLLHLFRRHILRLYPNAHHLPLTSLFIAPRS
jgi:hypothetical protein